MEEAKGLLDEAEKGEVKMNEIFGLQSTHEDQS
jgi:hypothetical protein